MLKKELLKTNDGSFTLFIPEWNEHYHSKHGAIQEAEHVFIQHGLQNFIQKEKIAVLEVGFGTGLNAFLTSIYADKLEVNIDYISIEKYPIELETIEKLNFSELLINNKTNDSFLKIHQSKWEVSNVINPYFNLKKIQTDFFSIELPADSIDLIYFDAFGIRVQPELWTEELFGLLYKILKPQGLLTTYACNGKAKRALQAVGFTVEKHPGPPGKREMMNAWKK